MCVDLRNLVLRFEWDAPGQAVEEDASERVDVGAGVRSFSPDLLRGDVVECPQQLSGRGELGAAAHALHQAEVGEVDVLDGTGHDENVGRLHIAVEQAARVCRVQGGGNL